MKISERQLRRLISEEVRAYKRGTISELGFLKKMFGRGGAAATAEKPAAAATAEDPTSKWHPDVDMPASQNLDALGGLTSLKSNGTIIDRAIKRNLITRQNTLMSDDDSRTPKIALEKYNEAIGAMTKEIEALINNRLISGEYSFAKKLSQDLIHSELGSERVLRPATPSASVQALLSKVFPETNSLGQKIYTYTIFCLVDSIANNRDAIQKELSKKPTEAQQKYAEGLKKFRESCKDSLATNIANIFGEGSRVMKNPYDVKEMLFSHLDSLDYKAIETFLYPIISLVQESAAIKKDQFIFERWQKMAGLLRG